MKRQFVECAVLLGIVMSVMFLAQTQDVVSHTDYEKNEDGTLKRDALGRPIVDVTHNDRSHPSCDCPEDDVDCKPDPRDFSDCGVGQNNSKGYKTSWALHAYGGKLSGTEAMRQGMQCQMRYFLRVDASVSAGNTSCSATVFPSIFPMPTVPVTGEEPPTFSGKAKVDLVISGTCYHKWHGHHGFFLGALLCNRCAAGHNGGHCELDYEKGGELHIKGPDDEGAWIGIDVLPSTESHTRSLTAGVDYSLSAGISASIDYSTSKTTEISGHAGLVYGIGQEITVNATQLETYHRVFYGNPVPAKMTKTATVSTGKIEDVSLEGITATYDGTDSHRCPGGHASGECGQCPPRMP